MCDAPPPYDSSYHQYITAATQATRHSTLPFLTKDYSHRHISYLINITFRKDARGTVHHDDKIDRSTQIFIPRPATFVSSQNSSDAIRVVRPVSLEEMQMIEGFQDCGTFQLPLGGIDSGEEVSNIHAHIARRLCNDVTRSNIHVESEDNVTGTLVQQPGNAIALHMYGIAVYSKYPTSLTKPEIAENASLLYQWSKLHSVYGPLLGPWNVDFADTVRNAVLRGGQEFKILVYAASEDQMKELQENWQEGTSVLHF